MSNIVKIIIRLAVLGILSGCAFFIQDHLDSKFGEPQVQDRVVPNDSLWVQKYYDEVKPIFESRCVVCHGCYDAPCQLKLASVAGIDRGASKEAVYNGARITAAKHLSPFVETATTQKWRERGFFPVLNEREQSVPANKEAGLLYRMLSLKRKHPLPDQSILPESFTLELDRKQECPTLSEFDQFAESHPLWGMPYALPGLNDKEHAVLTEWIEASSPVPAPSPLDPKLQERVEKWEAFFNRPTLKGVLVNRYIYEHLFLSHLYFKDYKEDQFFRLVRSNTPSGEPLKIIDSVRPYDDPKTDKFYYRLQIISETILAKTHMPYVLSDARMKRWQQLFYEADYEVTESVSYEVETSSNPFAAFQQLPVDSRYRFMLDEAQNTIMGFIKGPVCRGQVALNVIQDRFWVFFLDPDNVDPGENERFLAENSGHLRLPAESGNTLLPLNRWLHYSKLQNQYLQAKYKKAIELLDEDELQIDLNLIWDGDGHNKNATLTVFRHFDTASVVKGLIGTHPKTTWVINYPILERIHYLLVAGFDVFGNAGHQLLTRLYMDFLRMESEFNFLVFLPRDHREALWNEWYANAGKHVQNYFKEGSQQFSHDTDIIYESDDSKIELLNLLLEKLDHVNDQRFVINSENVPANYLQQLNALSAVSNQAVQHLSQVTFLSIEDDKKNINTYTILRNNAHSNITSLFREGKNRLPELDDLTIVNGIIGAYPTAFWTINENQLDKLTKDVGNIKSNKDYAVLLDHYGTRRTAKDFWQLSDRLHKHYRNINPVEFGMLDYNRIENR